LPLGLLCGQKYRHVTISYLLPLSPVFLGEDKKKEGVREIKKEESKRDGKKEGEKKRVRRS
jgi:hypothetical protein